MRLKFDGYVQIALFIPCHWDLCNLPKVLGLVGNVELVVHQTWDDNNLTPQQRAWQQTWTEAGFTVKLTDALGRYRDIQRFCDLMGSYDYMDSYVLLTVPAQKADYWRIIKLYLEGGIYADIDAYGSRQLHEFLTRGPPREPNIRMLVLQETSGSFIERFSTYVFSPQFTNMFIVADRGYNGLYRIVRLMTDNILSNRFGSWPEPFKTLRETGPACLTEGLLKVDPSEIMAVGQACWGDNLVDQAGVGTWREGTFIVKFLRVFYENGSLALFVIACFMAFRIVKKEGRTLSYVWWFLLLYILLCLLHQYAYIIRKVMIGAPRAFVPLPQFTIDTCLDYRPR
eukprot:Colp12_sorted_trinity150504_noHs@874